MHTIEVEEIQRRIDMEAIHMTWYHGFENIYFLRHVMRSGIELSLENLRERFVYHAADVLDDYTEQSWFDDELDKMAGDNTAQAIETAQDVADAASLVLAHTLLDEAVFEYLKFTARTAPDAWEAASPERIVKFALGEIHGEKFKQYVAQQMQNESEGFDRESLKSKLDRLNSVCRSAVKDMPKIDRYEFDLDRIEKLDKQRHKIVHPKGRRNKTAFEDFDSDLRFMFSTAEYCHVLVCRRFDYLPKEYIHSRFDRLFRIF